MEKQLSIKNKIVLVPFPFDDLSKIKVRPALCLSNSIGKFNHVVIAFITSKIPDDLTETDLVVNVQGNGFKETGLLVDSVIRVHKIVTIPMYLIKRELGHLNQNLSKEIKHKIELLFK
jgi:mRNA interferase MazF